MKRKTVFTALLSTAMATALLAQHQSYAQTRVMPGRAAVATAPTTGPHGGSLKQVDGVQLETVVSQGGLRMFVYGRDGKPVAVQQARGAASLHVQGHAKSYRYDLLPDGQGGLTAPVNLSQIAGRQIEIGVQLVGISATAGRAISLHEVATVPVGEQQLAASAVARQKICPVSGKPLGSMGKPVGVNVHGQQVFVCCGGCVSKLKANPAKYAAGRPVITVASATDADAALIARQASCPVMDEPLGSMGQPIKVMVGDKPIFLCCKGCIKKVQAQPAKYLAMVHGKDDSPAAPRQKASRAASQQQASPQKATAAGGDPVRPGVFRVTAADTPYVAAQKRCPVMDEPLDAMGGPYKVNAAGRAIYICCPGCAKKIAAEPQKYLALLSKQGVEAPYIR